MAESSKSPAEKRQPHGAREPGYWTKVLLAIVWPIAGVYIAGTLLGFVFGILSDVIPALETAIVRRSPAVMLTLNALVYIVALGVISLPLYNYFFGRGHSKKEVFGLQGRLTPRNLALVLLAFGSYFLTSAVVIGFAGSLLPFVNIDQPQELGLNDPETIPQYILIFLMLVVAAPVAEELIFRGFMFRALRERLPFWPTAVLVSIMFGIAHGQWNVGIDTFVLSMFLCGLREYTGSLWPAILLHALKNFLAFSLLFLFPDLIPAIQ